MIFITDSQLNQVIEKLEELQGFYDQDGGLEDIREQVLATAALKNGLLEEKREQEQVLRELCPAPKTVVIHEVSKLITDLEGNPVSPGELWGSGTTIYVSD